MPTRFSSYFFNIIRSIFTNIFIWKCSNVSRALFFFGSCFTQFIVIFSDHFQSCKRESFYYLDSLVYMSTHPWFLSDKYAMVLTATTLVLVAFVCRLLLTFCLWLRSAWKNRTFLPYQLAILDCVTMLSCTMCLSPPSCRDKNTLPKYIGSNQFFYIHSY